jgi:hypothetical protein
MPDSRSLLDRMMDFVDYHLGGTVVNRSPRKDRDRHDQPGFAGDGGGSAGGFDDCGSGGDSGGGDCGGGDGGGGGD